MVRLAILFWRGVGAPQFFSLLCSLFGGSARRTRRALLDVHLSARHDREQHMWLTFPGRPEEDRPDPEAYEAAWRTTQIIAEEPAAALIKLRDVLSEENYVNGGACVARFRIAAPHEILWGLHKNLFNEFEFLDRFFAHPVVTAALPEVSRPNELIREFKQSDAAHGFGYLLRSVIHGGLYNSFSGSDEDAVTLVTEFMRAAIGMRLSRTHLWINSRPWTAWFCGIAWDATYVWFDRDDPAIVVLLITDTD
jgi:hypothetical protein